MFRVYVFEIKIGAAPRSERRRTKKYVEHAPEAINRFGIKSLWQGRALPDFEKGDA